MSATVMQGDCLQVLPTLDADSVDAIVTDPPYHLTTGKKGGSGQASENLNSPAGRSRAGTGFMGKKWDGGAAAHDPALWREVLRVTKPGAYLVAFGGTRTFHRLTCAIEDAGWEIRDCLSWLFGSGFPKHAACLKPAWEPIILARKPAPKATPLNIDDCRIEGAAGDGVWGTSNATCRAGFNDSPDHAEYRSQKHPAGRWPANVILDEQASVALDEQSGKLTSGANPTRRGSPKFRNSYGTFLGQEVCGAPRGPDVGGASRFYYTAKASRSEREAGLDGAERKEKLWSSGTQNPGSFQAEGTDRSSTNHHPTVKPLSLMRWLCRLVTPPGGMILDPFAGSGSTGCAAVMERFRFLGIEREAEYVEIARRRIAHTLENFEPDLFAPTPGAPPSPTEEHST